MESRTGLLVTEGGIVENSLKRAKAIMRDIDATSIGESRNVYEETLCSKHWAGGGEVEIISKQKNIILIPQALFSQKKKVGWVSTQICHWKMYLQIRKENIPAVATENLWPGFRIFELLYL